MTGPERARLAETARTDPAAYSAQTSPDRFHSLGFALAGCLYMLRHQKNSRIMALATGMVLPLAFWLGLPATSWAILLLATASVWITEFVNAAIEAAVNRAGKDYHPMSRVAKDVAAAAVLLSALTALLIGLLLLGPPLLDRLQGAHATVN